MHLSNHYHLMIETPEPNLVEGMKWLQNAYTRRFNTRHRLWGRLFGDRYKAVVVEGERVWGPKRIWSKIGLAKLVRFSSSSSLAEPYNHLLPRRRRSDPLY